MPQMTVCPSCAEPLEPDDAFCGACGAELAGAAPPSAPPAAPRGGGTGDFVLAAPARLLLDHEDDEDDDDGGRGGDHDRDLEAAHGEAAHGEDGGAAAPGPDREEAADGPPCPRCGGRAAADGRCGTCGTAPGSSGDRTEQALDGVAGVSDRGLRHHRNEDSFAVAATSLPDGGSAVVAVVCDGVSSATRPDEASRTAADTASESLLTALESGTGPVRAMHDALLDAARAVDALARDGGAPEPGRNSPACTCVSAVAAGGAVTIGWVGDSRAYWIPDDRESAEPYRLTEDDSWAARMVAAGLMEEAEAYADPRAHAITGWLGADAGEPDPHTVSFTPHVPGVVLVCTDGLWNYAEAATDLADAVPADARTEPLNAARELVRFALAGGGHDNITVAVLPFPPAPGRRPEAPPEPTLVDLPVAEPPTA
ncbi:protein phosphatase 2C domain-containing protein [Streptacidiphilus sp. ASG 303]|uniref:PP2C family serine/threonine-protein phosphatase n=1 Tax=Streptacidiphilus sp. ASG 303 TaxID=2896847 RepID=UPI001E313A72|nr:PP2C family serine/threonine-protein phosphatase [Streptacidiphilus sp. ASG 303]MCD0482779.1 protein phosphatase 2C domain-containing protein [Streptacidiphilus sp. ASG 303]